jgi:hypothetical protein
MIIAIPNKTNKEHLEDVKTEMAEKGAPIIKAVYMGCWDMYVALEGSHRVTAAKELGLVPEIIEVEYSDERVDDEHNMDDLTIAEWCDCGSEFIQIKF